MNTNSQNNTEEKPKITLLWKLILLGGITIGGVFLLIILWISLLPAPFVLGSTEKTVERAIAANGSFAIDFSARMDHESVEQAVTTVPPIEGKFVWQDDTSVALVPKNSLTEGDHITLVIAAGAMDWLGKKTAEQITIQYVVTTAPQVTMISPISANDWDNILFERANADARQTPENTLWKRGEPLTVMFDRPMQVLQSASVEEENDTQTNFADYLVFDPPITGSIRLLGTTAFEFYADEDSWPEAQEISVTLRSGIPSLDGGTTTEEITWMLRTEPPFLREVRIGDRVLDYDDKTKTFSAQNILPDASVRMDWNMPLDLESLYGKMTIAPERKVKNDVIKRGDQKNALVFMDFDPPLARGETIEIIIDRDVAPLDGEFASSEPFRILFETLREPCLTFAGEKATNQIAIEPNGGVELELCTLTSWWDEQQQENISMEDALREHLVITPSLDTKDLSIGCGETTCTLWLPSQPGEKYELSFTADLTDVFGQPIPTDGFIGNITIKNYPPLISALTRGGLRSTYDASEPIDIFFTTRNVTKLNFTSCVVPPAMVRKIEGEGGWGWNDFSCARSGTNTRTRVVPITGETNQTNILAIPLLSENELAPAGTVYHWEANSNEVRDPWSGTIRNFAGAVYPINAALTAQHGSDFVTAWANDFATGKPISDMQISLIDQKGAVAGSGKTDERGLLTLQKPSESEAFYLEGKKDQLASFVGSSWEDGIAPWDFGLNYDWQGASTLMGTIVTDRPIYRPGDTVSFKGILRKDVDATYEVPLQKSVFVTIENSRNEVVYEKELPLDQFGTIADELPLADKSATGMFTIFVSTTLERDWNNLVSGVFWVEEYKKPEYKVSFVSDKEEYVSGDDFDTTIKTEYFFGTPLKDAKVEWHIVETPFYFDRWSGGGWFSFGTDENWCSWYCPENQEVVQRGEGATNENGELSVHFSLSTKTHALYTITATVIDANGRTVSANQTYPIFSGQFVLGVRTNDFWLDQNAKKLTAEILATDVAGNALPGKKFSATLQKATWNSIKKQDVDGNFYWENSQEFTELDTTTATTNIGGKVEVSFALKNTSDYFGDLRILVTATDDKGNQVAAADHIWRSSDTYSSPSIRSNNDRINIVVETPEVAPGEVIRILPDSPFSENVWAHVSVGRKQAVYHDVFLWQAGTPIEITATPEMMPNTFVIVTLFKGRGDLLAIHDQLIEYHEQKMELQQAEEKTIALRKKIGNITESLLSEQSAELMSALRKGMETTEQDLTKVQAETKKITERITNLEEAIRSVIGDEAAIPSGEDSAAYPESKVGIAPIIVSAESKRLQVKVTPSKKEYLPGEEVQMTLQVSDSFGNPVENADLSIAVVDESLLALKSRQNEDIFEVFFRMRDIGIQLASSLAYLINRLDVDTIGGQKGGGGGGDLDLLQKKRGEFRDTAFWLPHIQTDINGSATTRFVLPDNITSWQIWATANTLDSRFGSTKMNFFSRKPLLVTPLVPRFLIVGDTATVGATVVNRETDELIVRAEFDAQNVEIISKDAGSFRIPGNSEKTLYYTVRAKASGESPIAELAPALFTFSLQGDTATAVDTLEVTVPIKAPAVGESIATSGYLDTTTVAVQEKVQIPGGILTDVGELVVSVTSGAIGNITDGIAALARFPYGCTEQIMSAHLPNLAILQLITRQDAPVEIGEFDANKIREMVATGVQNIYAAQNPDGGFGFWQGSGTSYPYLTAYALFGLEQSAASGITVDSTVRDKAREYLRQKVWEDFRKDTTLENEAAFPDFDTRAFAMYVLSFGENFDESMLARLFEQRSKMSPEGKAFVMMTAYRVLNARPAPMVTSLLRELEQDAKQTDREAHFAASQSSWNFGSDVRATAIVLTAILEQDPNHPLIPKIMEYLRDKKQSFAGYTASPWGTTQNTAWVLFALIAFLEKHPLESAEVDVLVNLQSVLQETLDQAHREAMVRVPLAQVKTGITENSIDINKEGGGISYDIVAQYYLPIERVMARNHGFGVFRELFAFADKKMTAPIDSATQGEMIRGRATILVSDERYFVGVRIPIPAGTEAINFALDTEDQSLQNTGDPCHSYWCPENENWRFSHREYRDDHIFLFADYLPAGRYEFDYLLRASIVGEYQVLPSVAEEIYHPETFGRSEGTQFKIKEQVSPDKTPAANKDEEE